MISSIDTTTAPRMACRQEPRQFEKPCRLRSAKIGNHSRMHAWQKGQHDYHDNDSLNGSHERSRPPRRSMKSLKEERIDNCESPAVEQVHHIADDSRPVAVGREHRAKDEGNVDACETE